MSALEAERGQAGRTLHDNLGQQLTALMIGLKELERPLQGQAAAATLRSLQAIAEDLGRDLHALALTLRSAALEELGLARSLTAFMEDKFRAAKIAVEFDHADLGDSRLPAAVEHTLYYVLCEALLNVARHAAAARVTVFLRRRGRRVTAVVEDDGRGFGATKPARGGLAVLRGRVALMGGDVTLETAPGKGTTVIVRLPL